MILPFLIQLSETDKRIILAVLLLFILFVALLALIGSIMIRVMKWQSKKIVLMTRDAVNTGVIKDKKHFFKYARTKNWREFFIKSWIPLLILFSGFLILIIRNAATNDFSYDVFDYKKTGFSTIFFIWDFGNPENYSNFFGMSILSQWPALINTPHWEWEAWASYILLITTLVGGCWYFITLQCLLSRTLKIRKVAKEIFDKPLESYNINNM